MHDVAIIGGGVIGLSIACELAGEGVSVAVLDQGQIGHESSWAGAGILPPGNPDAAASPEARLRAGSHVLWPALSARLKDETGIDNGFRRCGGLEVRVQGPIDALDDEVVAWRREGVCVEPLDRHGVRQFETELNPETACAYRLPEMGQVRNPRHLKALMALAAKRGVKLLAGTPAYGFDRTDEKVVAVETNGEKIAAGQFVIAGGAWSGRLLGEMGSRATVRPMRGQIVLLALPGLSLKHVVNVGLRYLVPRGDGRVLVGSTEEIVGFDKRTTAGGVGGLVEFACEVAPVLGEATFERAWAGLRPQSADGLPYLGRVGPVENLFIATGHFRAGLQLSPITALVVSQLVMGRKPALDLAPYSADRHCREKEFANQGKNQFV